MASLGFLKNFKKGLEKIEGVNVGISAPNFWYSTGNYALNRNLSGSFFRGIPEGRITAFVGPSGSGKSFLSSNILKSAQDAGAHIVVMDSENAIDLEFLGKLGVKTDEEHLTYLQVGTIEDVNSICSEFFSTYEKEYGRFNYDAPKIVMLLDSLAMLSTETEETNYDKEGVVKGDMGQRAKRSKAMLRMILSRIARLPITFILTDHVYPADPLKGDGEWAITNSTRFFPSIIGLITRLKLREDSAVIGIRMRVEAFKTRFAKLGSKVEIEVPYSTGMSPYSGLLESLEVDGIVTKGGAWYSCSLPTGDIKFQRKQLNEELVQKLFSHPKLLQQDTEVVNQVEEELSELLNEEQE
jgi:recombination protein RecA